MKKIMKYWFKILILCFVLFQNSFSQWEMTSWKNNPEIRNIWASGKTAITYGDKLFTTNGGNDWLKSNDSIIKGSFINSILEKDNHIFLALSFPETLLVSSDFGKTWQKRENGLGDNPYVKSIISLDGKVFVFTPKGLFYSTDYGNNWIQKSNDIRLKHLNAVALVGDNIFSSVGTDNEIYLSTNQGESWTLKNNGLEKYTSFNQFAVIKDKLFVTSYNHSSIDGENKVIYMSSDMGDTWIKKNNAKPFKLSLFSFASIGNRLFLGSSETLMFSDDLGDTWIEKSVSNDYYRSAEYLAVGDGVIYGSSGTEIFKSYDNGDTWAPIRNAQNYGAVNSLFVNDDKIFSCTTPWVNYTTEQNGLYYSTDRGNSWLAFGFDSIGVTSLFFKDNYIFASTDDGLLRTDSQDISWKNIKEKLRYRELALLGDRLFYTDYGGYFISDDNGDNWTGVKDKLPSRQFVNKFFVYNDDILACLDSNVFISHNNGETWENISNGLPYDDLRISAIEKVDDVIFLGTIFGVYTSSDLGKNWVQRNNGLPLASKNRIEIKDFVVSGKNIFVGSRLPGGIFLSTDMGLNWKNTNTSNFKDTEISSLVIQGEYIYAGTDGTGFGDRGDAIYRAKLNDFGITSVEDQQILDESIVISPNPAKEYITINLSAINPLLKRGVEGIGFRVEGEAIVEIYDMMGVLVAQTSSSVFNGQTGTSDPPRIDVSNLSPGVYFVKIVGSNGVGSIVEKFVKI